MPERARPLSVSHVWQQAFGWRPLVLLTVALVAGIAWGDHYRPPVAPLVASAALSLGLAALIWRRGGRWTALPLLAGITLGGAAHMSVRLQPSAFDLCQLAGQREVQLVGVVQQAWPAREWGQRVVVRGESLVPPGYRGRLQITLPPQSEVTAGQQLHLKGVSLQRPAAAGTPGQLDQQRTLARVRIHTLGRARQITLLSPATAPTRWRQTLVERTRERLITSLRAAMPGSESQLYADLLAGMVFGIQAAPLPGEIITLFRRSATIHLLVVSGAQLSFIALGLVFLVRGRRQGFPLWGVPLILFALVVFCLVAGPGPSLNRALGMAVLLMMGLATGRRYDFPTALAASALILCLLDPSIVFDAGAQLTYACCLGVYLALPRRARLPANPLVRTLQTAGWSTLGAWAYSTPVLVAWFNSLPLLGGLANFIAVPLANLVLYIGFAASDSGLLAAPLAVPLCLLARGLLTVLLVSNRFFAALPGSTLELITFHPAVLILWYLISTAALITLRSPRSRHQLRHYIFRHLTPVLVGVISLSVITTVGVIWHSHRPRLLEVHVLDVGAGQCVVIRTPSGRTVMLDAGCDSPGEQAGRFMENRVLPYLARQRIRRLEYLISSHDHDDHCNFAGELLHRMAVGHVVTGPDLEAGAEWAELHQAAAQRLVPCSPATAGLRWQFTDDCYLQVLEPRQLLQGTDNDTNNNSLVLRLEYKQISFLFPADLQQAGEIRLLADYARQPELLQTTMLMASHHGSPHSNLPRFVRAVRPQVVVVSRGSHRRGADTGLQVFHQYGLPVWSTDLSGTLRLQTAGTNLTVSETYP